MTPPSAQLPDSNPSAPRATLEGLPTEVKARIVEHCAMQDERWKELRKHLEACVDTAEKPAFEGAITNTDVRHAFQAVKEAYKSTIGALFRLSRLWSTLAAPFLFEEVRTSQTNSLFFHHHIVPRHRHFFRKVTFDAHDPHLFHAFIQTLPYLTTITEAVITVGGFEDHLDDGPESGGISWAALTDSSPFGLATFFSQLTHLKTDIPRYEQVDKLVSAAPNLQSLHLGYVDHEDGRLVRILLSARGEHPLPAITSLKVSVNGDVGSTMRFAQHFASSIERITFDLAFDLNFDYADDVQFPKVRTLKLEGDPENIETFLECMTRDQFPALVELVICSHQLSIQLVSTMQEAVKTVANKMPRLEKMHLIDPQRLLDDSDCDAMRQNLDNHSIELTTSIVPNFVSSTIFLADDRIDDIRLGGPVRFDIYRPDIKRTLDFLGEWFERAEGPGADGELARLARVLQQAEFERVARAC
ncbi:Proteophosphoglycan ppg4 [Rhodotorula toruloides]|nr:Proteophosphoglycan ppg4 [Rhodotorula toruloides]